MQNSYSIEDLIEMLEDVINKATRIPMSKKSAVDIDAIADIITDMRMALPMEIQQAQKVVMDKNNIIEEAKQKAESIIREAEQRRTELLDKNDIVIEARRRVTEMVNKEQNDCADLRASTVEYAVRMLQRIEELLGSDLEHIRILRTGISGSESKPQQPEIKLFDQPIE